MCLMKIDLKNWLSILSFIFFVRFASSTAAINQPKKLLRLPSLKSKMSDSVGKGDAYRYDTIYSSMPSNCCYDI